MSVSEDPKIKKIAGDVERSYYSFYIPEDFVQFPHHFSNAPIIAGVTQVDWVVRLIEDYMGPLRFMGMSKIKFMRPILPQTTMNLTLTRVKKSAWQFHFEGNGRSYSSGQIDFHDR